MINLSRPLSSLVQLYIIILFVRAIFSWFPIRSDSPLMPVVRFVHVVTEPVLAPFRRIIPPVGMFDISYLVVFLLFEFVVYRIVYSVGL